MSNWTPAFSNWIDVDRVTPPYRRPAPRGIALVAACTLALQFGGGCMLPKYATAGRLTAYQQAIVVGLLLAVLIVRLIRQSRKRQAVQ